MGLNMSVSTSERISAFQAIKGQRKIVCLTAYTAPMAAALDPWCDLLLVGDSVGMVVYGMTDTKHVTLEIMIRHAQAVIRRRKTAVVVVDLPRGSYESGPEQALVSATQILQQTGADAVKLEGGIEVAASIERLRNNGIQVMGHIGLLPQRSDVMRITGRTDAEEKSLLADRNALMAAGAFSLVIEGVIEPVAANLAADCSVPSIGIGASAACDGQILVSDDMLGLYDGHKPKFARAFDNLHQNIAEAAQAYRSAVIEKRFPSADEIYQNEAIGKNR